MASQLFCKNYLTISINVSVPLHAQNNSIYCNKTNINEKKKFAEDF
jgi:hypothetical protein